MLLDDMLDIYAKIGLEFQSILEIKNELKKVSEKYSNQKKALIEYLFKYNNSKMIYENSTRVYDEIEILKKYLNEYKFEISTYQRELIRFESKCVILKEKNQLFFDYEDLIENGENFLKEIERYYQENKDPIKAYIVIESLDEFIKEIEKINIELKSLNSINKILDSQNIRVLNSVEGIVELKLFSELSLNEVIAALLIIRNIYNQIKDLLEIEEEIEIIKIETGSLRCKILGNKIIMGMISAMFVYMAKDLYNSSLNPIKKDEIRRKEFNELLDFKAKMQKLGIGTSGIDKKIEEINNTLFDASEMLIKSTDKIKINDEIFKIKLPERKELELNFEKLRLQLDYKKD